MEIFQLIISLLAYFIGAIPTGYLVARLKGISDIRHHGSGNIGATNVSRSLGIHYFFLIFFLDAGKAFLFIRCVQPYFDYNYLCIFAALILLGNCYSLFLRGSGGKGVATLCGLIAALQPTSLPLLFGTWIILMLITKTVGIASVGAVLCLPVVIYAMHNNILFLFSLFAAIIVVYKHKKNIINYVS